MSKRYGKARVPDCECEQRYTCGPCLRAATPTGGPQGTCPDKGLKNGKCNRTRCPNRPATWFSTVEQAFYCEPCALEINKWVPGHLPKLAMR